MTTLRVTSEVWPLARDFAISRGAKREAAVVVVRLADGGAAGQGECVPYTHYGESVDQTVDTLARLSDAVAGGLDRQGVQTALPCGAARNALDCAFWDLEAKRAGKRAWELMDNPVSPEPALSAETIGIDCPEAMGGAAAELADRPLIKIKLDCKQVIERVSAVRSAAPGARLIVDVNEGWTLDLLNAVAGPLDELGVEMIEQPLPAAQDAALADYTGAVLLSADESLKGLDSLAELHPAFGMINVKLDKAGGLTEALAMARQARSRNLRVMVGCMVATSLAMAPAMVLAPLAEYMDLDGPLWLAEDRQPGLTFQGGLVHPPEPGLWG